MVATSLDQELARAITNLDSVSNIALPRATRRAVNVVARKVVTLSTREAAKQVKVPKKLVDSKVTLLKARIGYSYSKINVDRRGISAIRLPNVQTKYRRRRGKIVRGSGRIRAGRHTYDRAFVQRGAGGNWHVFQRKYKARYPIDVVKVPIKEAVTEAFNKHTTELMRTQMPAQLKTEITKELNRVLK